MTKNSTIRPTDPKVIIAGIRQFGLAADGSDLRDLEAAIERADARPAQEQIARAISRLGDYDDDAADGDANMQWHLGYQQALEDAEAAILSLPGETGK